MAKAVKEADEKAEAEARALCTHLSHLFLILMQGNYTYYLYEVHTAYLLTLLKTLVERGKSKICRCDNYSRAKVLAAETIQRRKLIKGGNY